MHRVHGEGEVSENARRTILLAASVPSVILCVLCVLT